jgi:pimeloyl-ACP methyl ester carboxylesterase
MAQTVPLRHVRTGDNLSVMLETRREGDPAGEPVLLLHGFPQTGAAWDAVTPALVEAGYRVEVPLQRGYSAAFRPPRRSDYRLEALVDDVVELIDEPVHLVGHDWGAIVAWALAARRPELLRSVTAVSVPHPGAFRQSLLTSSQGLRSTYMAVFQLPVVPERLLLARDGGALRKLLRASGLDAARTEAYVAAMREPGALTAALNWYRGLPLSRERLGRVRVPTLYVWGDRDVALGRAGAERTAGFVTGPYEFVPLTGAGHWIPERHAPELLSALLPHLERNARV